MPEFGSYSVVVARVSGPHGVNGELKAVARSDVPGRIEALDEVCVHPRDEEPFMSRVLAARPVPHKPTYILRLEGVTDRNQAQALTDAELTVKQAESPQLPEGTYYASQILGLRAVTDEGEALGAVVEILRTGANDVYVTDRKLLIPATAEVVLRVDLSAGEMLIRPLPGMFD